MATRVISTIVALRRDKEANIQTLQNSYVPRLGEVFFIDTYDKRLRAKVGDGENLLKDLPYTDEPIYEAIDAVVIRGYYMNDKFYTDSTYQKECVKSINKIYIDNNSKTIYNYDGEKFVSVNDTLPTASDVVAGIMKLYETKGQHTDGTMTQKSITDNLNTKIEVMVDSEDDEQINFFIG